MKSSHRGDNPTECYEEWDVGVPPLPSRSRLYCLEPIGIGTPYVESLTSYVARLARKHHVLSRELVKREIFPLQGMEDTDPNFYYRLNVFFISGSQSINGTGVGTKNWLEALQILTSRNDLRFLTMFTWSEVIATKRLLRSSKAWCPQCYKECIASNQTVYDHLLWSLNGIDVCPLHLRHLVTKCPRCQKPQPPIPPNTLLGYCSSCRNWLGDRSESSIEEPVSFAVDGLKKQIWIASRVGELLASAADFSAKLPKDRIATVMRICLNRYAGGNLSALSRLFGITVQSLWSYFYRGGVPYFESLLQMCQVLSMAPLEFFMLDTSQSLSAPFEPNRLRQVGRSRKKWQRVTTEDIQYIRLYLEAILKENLASLPSLKEVALELGYSVNVLHRHCPDLSRRFLTSRRSWTEEFFNKTQVELENALVSREPVPLSKVLRSLDCDRDVLYRYFPKLCQAIVTRYKERFNTERIRQRLQDAIASDKVTFVAQIARDFGYASAYIHGLFPDLCKQITAQYRAEQKKQHELRVESECIEVKQAILTIHEQGLFPSERSVRSKLSDPNIMRRKEGREMWRSIMVELGYSKDVRKTD